MDCATELGLLPRPVSAKWTAGSFRIGPTTAVVAEAEAMPAVALVRAATGLGAAAGSGPAIRLRVDPSAQAEAYRLAVEPGGVLLSSGGVQGLFHAAQTLLQLLPPSVYGSRSLGEAGLSIPGVAIEDAPRFPWRDLMLDCARHFFPLGFVRRAIDLAAMHKLNRFHWHLTDDQGWRIEIRKYPRLTEVGAWRRRTQLGHARDLPTRYGDVPHGGFYTQAEIRGLVRYAADRGVTIVPEIDMPGHMQAAIAAYPELGTGETVEVCERWLINTRVLHPREATVTFMQDVLREVMELFPSRDIHIGGDECEKAEWRASAEMQALIRSQGLGDEAGLQAWFIRRMADFLRSNGRKLVGWDEIREGGLAEGATVMSWRGLEGGVAAASGGHDAIMVPQGEVYLDHYQSEDRDAEPLAFRGTTTLAEAYAFDPVPPELDADAASHVIGTGAKLWTEYVPTAEHAEYMLLPRLCAIAEVAWTRRELRDFADFRRRLAHHLRRLEAMGLRYRKLDRATAA